MGSPHFEWLKVTQEEFDHFRAHGYFADYSKRPFPLSPLQPPGTPMTVGSHVSSTSTLPTKVESWQKGVKRDPEVYPELKQDSQWNDWLDKVRIYASYHDVEEVLDPDYDPTKFPEDIEVFDKKQKFMFVVLRNKVKTNMGTYIVRKYISAQDAQGVFRELFKYYQNSTFAQIRCDELINKLTTAKMHCLSLRHGLVQGIADYVRLMDEYDKLAPFKDHTALLGEQQRLVYLQHYVSGIEELARVYYDDKRDQVVHSRPPMGYHKYLELLMHYATHVDTSQNMNADTSNYQ
jgi:hypothetical protein